MTLHASETASAGRSARDPGLDLGLDVRFESASAGPTANRLRILARPERRLKVLVIDDNADLRLGLTLRLHASGYDTAVAADAVSALGVVQREAPDAILLDLGLPGGDGFLVLERLRRIPKLAGIPVIVITAREPGGDGGNEVRARALGAVGFFQKPVDDENLMGTLALLLNPHWKLDQPLPGLHAAA